MKTLSAVTLVLVVGAIGGIGNEATAAPITYDFTGSASGYQALGASQTYTASGGPTITAISGSYTQSGTGIPVAGDAFAAGGRLKGSPDPAQSSVIDFLDRRAITLMRPRKSGSQQTRRWSEVDSNHRSLSYDRYS